MADNPFADLIPAAGGGAPAADNPFADLIPAKSKFALSDAVTDIPHEIARTAGENIDAIKKGLLPSGQGGRSQLENLGNAAKGILAVPALALSPLTGTAKSLLGHSLAQAEHAAGTLIAPEIAAKDDPQKMYDVARGDVDTALSAAGSRGGPVAPAAAAPPNQIAAAADRLAATGNKVEVPQALASDSMIAQRTGQALRNVPVVGDAIPQATARLTGQLEDATKSVASEFGGGSGPNVAHSIGQTIGGAAERETTAAKAATANSDQAVLAAWENNVRGANEAVAGAETGALQRARATIGDMSPQDMGETLIARLRQGEQEARATKDRLYGVAGESDGSINGDAVRGVRGRVSEALKADGRVVDDQLTPAANRMMAELDNIPNLPKSGGIRPALGKQEAPASPKSAAADTVQSKSDQPQSLLQFIASKGGLGPDAELEAIGAHGHTVQIDGLGRRKLVRQGGLPLDYAREAAEEAGYLRGDHKGTSTTNDLLDAIDAEMRGQKRYPEGFEGTRTKREAAGLSERAQHEQEAFTRGFEDDLAAAGHGKLAPDVKKRAIDLMARNKMDADTAVEHAISQLEQEDRAGISRASGFPGDRPSSGPPVSMQAIELTRKRLNSMAQAATNDADRSAARRIIREFDNWLGDAFDNALFSGSDAALQSFRAARAANTEWRQRFGFNARDDADRVVNRIVTGEVTPQEVSNYLIGASKVGAKGVSSRLLTRIAEATGGDPEAMGAIRGGVWNKLSSPTEGVTAKASPKIADDISEFFNGSGRDVANRLFSEPQRAIAMTYANALRQGEEARRLISEVAANTRPSPMEVGIGPLQKLANDVLGKSGGRSDEALYSAINAYAKSGARGDINLLSRIVRAVPEADRGNLASAMIRDMGVSPRTGQFSPDVFVSSWNTYKPEAKALLFGMSGPQRVALDDIAKISQRMKEVGSRFGNPSGTAQNANFFALATSLVAAPLSTITAAVGGGVAAKLLSSPVGAVSVSRWSRAYERLASVPGSVANIENYKRATAMLSVNISRETGSPIKDIMRQLQGPVPAAADEKQQQPVGVGD